MLRQSLHQKLSQKLSPRQIQLMKLIQIPTLDMEMRIKEELEANPALEEADQNDRTEEEDEFSNTDEKEAEKELSDEKDEMNDYEFDEYDSPYDSHYDRNIDDEKAEKSIPIKADITFFELLMQQLNMLDISEEDKRIAVNIIGSIDDDGYLRRTSMEISDDLAFKENLIVEPEKVKELIEIIQTFEPAGIAAYDLQECLIIQLKQLEDQNEQVRMAVQIMSKSFNEFTKKHYQKICDRHKLTEDELKIIIDLILKLSPKPGFSYNETDNSQPTQYIYPDFYITNDNEKITISLNDKNIPHLRVTPDFHTMLESMHANKSKSQSEKEAEAFIKQNIESANWFIDAIKQRKETLMTTMNAIVNMQRSFFLSGNPLDLKPMILKDIAEVVNLDISTISRVSRSKYAQTQFGIFPLKYFFTDSYTNEDGEDISIINVKNALRELIEKENKQKPYSDAKLTEIMIEKGFNVARRTIAKYRDQLNIPVAQLRKEL